jgi:DNA-binding transcriptional LysR family regulator
MAATGLLPSARFMTKNLLVVQSLIRSRTCSGILPEFMAAEFLDDRRLKATRLEHKREVWLLVQPHLKDDPGARIVIDWVRDSFSMFRR